MIALVREIEIVIVIYGFFSCLFFIVCLVFINSFSFSEMCQSVKKSAEQVNESRVQPACRAYGQDQPPQNQKTVDTKEKKELSLMHSTAELSERAAFTMRITIQPH